MTDITQLRTQPPTQPRNRPSLRRLLPRRGVGALRAAALLAIVGLAVASCSTTKKGVCPRIAILAQAGELTEVTGGDQVAYRVEMSDVRVECEYRTGDMLEMTADVTARFTITKGPGMQGDTARFNYFVSVTDRRGNVLNKRVFPVTADFRGRQTFTFTDTNWQFYRMTRGGTGLSYEIWLGFQLTDAQLEYNRRKGVE